MSIGSAIVAEALEERTLFLFAALIVVLALVRTLGAAARKRMHGAVVAFSLHALLVPIAGVLRATKSTLYEEVLFASLAFAALTAIFIVGTFLFEVVTPRIRVRVPRIL